MSSAAKRARKKKLAHERQDRELLRPTRQMDPADLSDPEMEQTDDEVRFSPRGQSVEQMPATPATVQADNKCEYLDIVNMIKTLNGAIAAISRDTTCIQRAYEQLRSENVARDKTLADLSEIVREYGLASTNRRPQPVLREDVVDRDGNLRGADIGITWVRPGFKKECRHVDLASMAAHVVTMRTPIHSRTHWPSCVGWDIPRVRQNCDRS